MALFDIGETDSRFNSIIKSPSKSLIQRFDDFIGTRISPLVQAVKRGDILALGDQIRRNIEKSAGQFTTQLKGSITDPTKIAEIGANFSSFGMAGVKATKAIEAIRPKGKSIFNLAT